MEKLNIYQRLNEIRKKVEYIKKDSAVQGYKAVSHDSVTAELRPFLIEFGVMVVPSQLVGESLDSTTTTGKGVPIIRYEATYKVDFVNIDTPEEKVSITVQSHALDFGDKAPGKAFSYATKYAMLKLFSIETGEDDESRVDSKPKPYTEDERKYFNRFIESDDQLGFYLFGRKFLDFNTQNMEGWTALNSDYTATVQRGDKGKEKERLTSMEKVGKEIHEAIVNAINENDSLALKENMEDIGKFTKKLLWNSLTAEEQSTAKTLIGE